MINPIELATRLININSTTPNDNGCQTIIKSILKQNDMHYTDLSNNDTTNSWFVTDNEGPLFVFSGHTDTVPSGPTQEWMFPPYQATQHNDKLYGRGTADMKSSVAAMCCAITQFLQNTPDPNIRIGVMLTSDEEGPGTNGTIKIVEYLMQQKTKIHWCLVGEATSLETLGDAIKIGRRGSLHGTLHLIGKQGHIAYPALADNPIHRCFSALDELTTTQWDKGNEHFPPTSFQIYNIHADTGASNMIPGALNAQFNFRFSPESQVQTLKARVTQLLEQHQLNFSIDWTLSGRPFFSKPGKLTAAISNAIENHCGITPAMNTLGGTSDGRFIAATGAEIIEFGPLNNSIHQTNEHILTNDIQRLTNIYVNTLTNLNQQNTREN